MHSFCNGITGRVVFTHRSPYRMCVHRAPIQDSTLTYQASLIIIDSLFLVDLLPFSTTNSSHPVITIGLYLALKGTYLFAAQSVATLFCVCLLSSMHISSFFTSNCENVCCHCHWTLLARSSTQRSTHCTGMYVCAPSWPSPVQCKLLGH